MAVYPHAVRSLLTSDDYACSCNYAKKQKARKHSRPFTIVVSFLILFAAAGMIMHVFLAKQFGAKEIVIHP
jgi:hypothetical protein